MASESDAASVVASTCEETSRLLASSNFQEALLVATSASVAGADESQKNALYANARDAFAKVKDSSIDAILEDCDSAQRDNILKYVFKAMSLEDSDKNICSSLLKWHAKLVAKDGSGILMRALVDTQV